MVLTGNSTSRSCSAGAGPSKAQMAAIKELLKAGTLDSVLAAASQRVNDPKKSMKKQTKGEAPSPVPVSADGWKTVGAKKVAAEECPKACSDTLIPGGWNVPVWSEVDALTTESHGVGLASKGQTRSLLSNLKGSKQLAVLSPVNIDGAGKEMSVPVKDKDNRMQVRRRFLFQLGEGTVEYTSDAPRPKVEKDTGMLVLTLSKDFSSKEVWKTASSAPQNAVREWLRGRLDAEVLEVRRPTRMVGDTERLQLVAAISKSQIDAGLRKSGTDGVFVRRFFEEHESRDEFRIVPLRPDTTLKDALAKASGLGEKAWGIIVTKRGLAIRVLPKDFEEVIRSVRPQDHEHFTGQTYEISGLPAWMGSDGLRQMLGSWDVSPVATFRKGFRRTWIVRATEGPIQNIMQHEDGIAVIQLAGPPRRPQKPPIERWNVPGRTMQQSAGLTYAKAAAQAVNVLAVGTSYNADPVAKRRHVTAVAPGPADASTTGSVAQSGGAASLDDILHMVTALTQQVGKLQQEFQDIKNADAESPEAFMEASEQEVVPQVQHNGPLTQVPRQRGSSPY